MPVAVEIDQPQIGVAPGDVGGKGEGREVRPLTVVTLVETGYGFAQQDQVFLAIAGQIHNLLPAAS